MRQLNLSGLNPPQKQAVLTTEGPVLIFAGAGSGKTRVLTYRIAHLIADQGVMPSHILAITFTNKAAKEMRERLSAILGSAAEPVWVSTFHAMCARILRRDIEKLGYTRQFSIYDDDDSMRVVKDALKALNLSDKLYAPRELRSIISDCKNKMLSAQDFLASSNRDFRAQKIHDVFVWYEKALKQNNALDFDDLLIKTLELFVQHPPVLDYYRQRFYYIHVDEYQDTNMPQYQLVHLLAGGHGNVCVVGDDDQSIYSWRGADIRNILEFEKDYPGCTSIKLEQNYRSTGHILSAANGVIAHNMGRKRKKLWTDKPLGEPVCDVAVRDEHEEARFVVRDILKQIAAGAKPGDCAVLYRVNAQSRVMEEHLVQSGIAYRVYGGLRFYDRAEVKDLLAYMRVISNPDDGASLLRIINTPRRAIGETTIAYLQQCALGLEESLCTVVMDLSAAPDLKARAGSGRALFAAAAGSDGEKRGAAAG
jgi:DNA helicase-2/ATP-dependent DNA helicase PcrA